jgi:uncharacterized protein
MIPNSDTLKTPLRLTPWRWALAGLGVACFVLGAIGAMVPGMPTTVFLLIGSYLLTRSCPWLEERLLRIRVLRPYAEFVRSKEPMSIRARWVAFGLMSASIACSVTILFFADKLPWLVGGLIGGMWVIGAVAILRFRRPVRASGNDGSSRSS